MNKKRILVVEDTEKHINAAWNQLKDHYLRVVSGYDQAVAALKEGRFEGDALKKYNEMQYLESLQSEEFDKERSKKIYGIQDELKTLRLPTFDVVLTDLMMPKGGWECMGNIDERLITEQAAYGYPIALHAIREKTPNIAILSEGGHHDHPMFFSLDNTSGLYETKHSKIKIYACHTTPMEKHEETYVKNWRKALEALVRE